MQIDLASTCLGLIGIFNCPTYRMTDESIKQSCMWQEGK